MGNGCGCGCGHEDVSRRTVLGVMAAAVAVPVLSQGARADDAPAGGTWVKTVKPGNVADKSAKAIKGPDLKAIVILVRDGKVITAISPTCTHKRCDVAPAAGKELFHCKCHGAEFDFTGKNTKGPSNSPATLNPLGHYALRLNGDGVIEVDTSAAVDADAKGASLTVEG